MKKLAKFLFFPLIATGVVLPLTSCVRAPYEDKLEIEGENSIEVYRDQKITKQYVTKVNGKKVDASWKIINSPDRLILDNIDNDGNLVFDPNAGFDEGVYVVSIQSKYKDYKPCIFYIVIHVMTYSPTNYTINPSSALNWTVSGQSGTSQSLYALLTSKNDTMGTNTDQKLIWNIIEDDNTNPNWQWFSINYISDSHINTFSLSCLIPDATIPPSSMNLKVNGETYDSNYSFILTFNISFN